MSKTTLISVESYLHNFPTVYVFNIEELYFGNCLVYPSLVSFTSHITEDGLLQLDMFFFLFTNRID